MNHSFTLPHCTFIVLPENQICSDYSPGDRLAIITWAKNWGRGCTNLGELDLSTHHSYRFHRHHHSLYDGGDEASYFLISFSHQTRTITVNHIVPIIIPSLCRVPRKFFKPFTQPRVPSPCFTLTLPCLSPTAVQMFAIVVHLLQHSLKVSHVLPIVFSTRLPLSETVSGSHAQSQPHSCNVSPIKIVNVSVFVFSL